MYTVTYHSKVAEDIKGLSAAAKRQIKTAIEDKLMSEPTLFGKPLQFSLKGLRSLRVGNYRVVFSLSENEVYIVLIAHRSVVYKNVVKRL